MTCRVRRSRRRYGRGQRRGRRRREMSRLLQTTCPPLPQRWRQNCPRSLATSPARATMRYDGQINHFASDCCGFFFLVPCLCFYAVHTCIAHTIRKGTSASSDTRGRARDFKVCRAAVNPIRRLCVRSNFIFVLEIYDFLGIDDLLIHFQMICECDPTN